jgi:hypothetical protein
MGCIVTNSINFERFQMTHTDWEEQIQACRWNALHNAAKAMADTGGGFAGAIADAWYKADKSNMTRLEKAFPDLFFRFMSEFDRSYFGDTIH